MIEKGHGRPRGSEERPMDWRVEVRLTKPDATAVLSLQKVLDFRRISSTTIWLPG
jgi:hypothetical protein